MTLSKIHTAEAARTLSAVSGRPAQRSIAHSSRLRLDRLSPLVCVIGLHARSAAAVWPPQIGRSWQSARLPVI
jgi:hypothetical protein